MLSCFKKSSSKTDIPITLLLSEQLSVWLKRKPKYVKNWVKQSGFAANAGQTCLVPDTKGNLSRVLVGISDVDDIWAIAGLPLTLPEQSYYLDINLEGHLLQQTVIAWGLGAYQFERYKLTDRNSAKLVLPKHLSILSIDNIVSSIYFIRDLINSSAADLTPLGLTKVAMMLGKKYRASVSQLTSGAILEKLYPATWTIGSASYNAPRIIDLRWGNKRHPKLVLIGKGVCFDAGGLNMKSGKGMALMKKDMAGAAYALGLAKMIMEENLPVRLRVLIPAIENVVSGGAYHPGDVIKMRNNVTVEVTNTDAEGRLILADALLEATVDEPDLLIDFATLTGAGRIALGTDMPAMFCNDEKLSQAILAFSDQEYDPMWQMPLYAPYFDLLKSNIADIKNAASEPYGGAIIAALFLLAFIPNDIPWIHFDMMAWNLTSRPGRPEGGEAMGLRAVFGYLKHRFSLRH